MACFMVAGHARIEAAILAISWYACVVSVRLFALADVTVRVVALLARSGHSRVDLRSGLNGFC